MIGLAAKPGTEVDPTCSRASTRSPSAARILVSSAANRSGQAGSGGTISMSLAGAAPPTHGLAPSGAGVSEKRTMSAGSSMARSRQYQKLRRGV